MHFQSIDSPHYFQTQPGPSKKRCSDGPSIFSDADFTQLKKRKLILEIEALESEKTKKKHKLDLEIKNLEVQIQVGQARARFLEVATNIVEQNPEYLCQICRFEP